MYFQVCIFKFVFLYWHMKEVTCAEIRVYEANKSQHIVVK